MVQHFFPDPSRTPDSEAKETAHEMRDRPTKTDSIHVLGQEARSANDAGKNEATLAHLEKGKSFKHSSEFGGHTPSAQPSRTAASTKRDTANSVGLIIGPPRITVSAPELMTGSGQDPASGSAPRSSAFPAHQNGSQASLPGLDQKRQPWHTRTTAYLRCEYTHNNVLTTSRVYVERLTPQRHLYPTPVLFIQGEYHTSDVWFTKPDGHHGWASDFLLMGYEVVLLDLPPHGRSLYGLPSDVGSFMSELQLADPALIEAELTGPGKCSQSGVPPWPSASKHNKWPGAGLHGNDPYFAKYCTSLCPSVASREKRQMLYQCAIASVLQWLREPATVLIGQGTGATVAWLAADVVPQLVACVLAVEPDGPPFGDVAALRQDSKSEPVFVGRLGQAPGKLRFGISDIPLKLESSYASSPFSPPRSDPQADQQRGRRNGGTDADHDGGGGRGGAAVPAAEKQASRRGRHIHLCRFPHAVVTAEASSHSTYDWATVNYLKQAGVTVHWLKLQEFGITGNGHLCFLEVNSNAIAKLLGAWIQRHISCARPQPGMLGYQMPLEVPRPQPSTSRRTPLREQRQETLSRTDPSLKDVNIRYRESISHKMTPERPTPMHQVAYSGLWSAQSTGRTLPISELRNPPAPHITALTRPGALAAMPGNGFGTFSGDQTNHLLHHTDSAYPYVDHTGMAMNWMGGQQLQGTDRANCAFDVMAGYGAVGGMGETGEMSSLYNMDGIGGLDGSSGFSSTGTIYGMDSGVAAPDLAAVSLQQSYAWSVQQYSGNSLQQPLGDAQLGQATEATAWSYLLPGTSNIGFSPTLPTDLRYPAITPGVLPLDLVEANHFDAQQSVMGRPHVLGPDELAYRIPEADRSNMARAEPRTVVEHTLPEHWIRETPPSPTAQLPRRKAASGGSVGDKAKARKGQTTKRRCGDSSAAAAGMATAIEAGASRSIWEESAPKRMRPGNG